MDYSTPLTLGECIRPGDLKHKLAPSTGVWYVGPNEWECEGGPRRLCRCCHIRLTTAEANAVIAMLGAPDAKGVRLPHDVCCGSNTRAIVSNLNSGILHIVNRSEYANERPRISYMCAPHNAFVKMYAALPPELALAMCSSPIYTVDANMLRRLYDNIPSVSYSEVCPFK